MGKKTEKASVPIADWLTIGAVYSTGLKVGDHVFLDLGPSKNDPAPKTLTITHYSAERFDSNWPGCEGRDGRMPVVDFIAWLQERLAEIPKRFRSTATIEIDSESGYEDSHYASIEILYTRPETKKEVAERLAEYEDDRLRAEASERARFEALKAKFEPPKVDL